MLRKLVEIAQRPRRRPTKKALMRGLGWQCAFLAITLIVLVFWPERAPALVPFVFFSLATAGLLLMEVYEGRLGEPDDKSDAS